MLLRFVSLFSFLLLIIFYSCSPQNSQVVAKFGNQTIGLKEFEKAYVNNAGSYEQAKKDSLSKLKNYLDLYVDFRLKLRDAVVRGFDSDTAMQKEVKDYKNQIGSSYLIEKKLVEPALNKLYDRRKWEYRVSHIMLRPDSTGLKHPKELAEKILDSLKHGADWDEMVKKYSTDTYSKNDGGDIFYVTAGQLPAAFEDAVYSTEPGQIYPGVVESPFGVHIIKVTDKRLRVAEIQASHIFANIKDSTGKVDTVKALAKINSAMQKLKEGVDFAEAAKEYSDDPGSKVRGGDLGYFNIRMMVKPFAMAAFDLKNIGDVSGIIRSPFGYHIIKLTGRKPEPPFDSEKDDLKKIYNQARYQYDYNAFVDSLRNKFNYKLIDSSLNKIVGIGDTVIIGQHDSLFTPIMNLPLFTYDNKSFSVGLFLDSLKSRREFIGKKYDASTIDDAAKSISGSVMIDNDVNYLEKTDPGFADLMENYRQGIYIFKLQEDEVWNKIHIDSTGLANYFDAKRAKYVWPDRVRFDYLYSKQDSLIKNYYSQLQNGKNFDTLLSENKEKPAVDDQGESAKPVDVKSSDLAQMANSLDKDGSYSVPFSSKDGYVIVRLLKKDPAHPMTFDEAKVDVTNAFQDEEIKRLESNYVERLRKLYKPEIYYDKLEQAFKSN